MKDRSILRYICPYVSSKTKAEGANVGDCDNEEEQEEEEKEKEQGNGDGGSRVKDSIHL